MASDFFEQRRPHQGLTYEAYFELMTERANQETAGLSEEDADRVTYTKLNLQRSDRIGRTYQVRPTLKAALHQLEPPQLWMVLTEPWCGDSAQCLPYIAAMAEVNPGIELRILLRDQNLDIMDQFLTGSSRSIPKLVAYRASGAEIFQWGPRPAEAQKVFEQAKAEGLEKPELLGRLHLWYGRDRGKAIEEEFEDLLSKQNAST